MLRPWHGMQRFLAIVTVCVVALTGCASGSQTSGGPGATAPSVSGVMPAGVDGVQVFVEPEARATPVLHAIESATRSVWVEVYLLTDTTVVHALEDAAQRGVDVRVLLELHPYGGGAVSAAKTLEALNAGGVKARGADSAYLLTHEKAMVIDNATAYIMTCNLSVSALGGSSYGANREYGVIDTHAADVQEVAAIFQADWDHTTPTLSDPNLVVSPVNAREVLSNLLAGARTSIKLEDEEMYDTQSEDALIAAAGRGVAVEVLLPKPSSGGAGSDVLRLEHGGVQVRFIKSPYMHAKLIVTDGSLAFVGSENFSAASLDRNREVGILLHDTQALATFQSTYARDWAVASPA